MKPLKLYFAGAWSGTCKPEEVTLGIKNKLVSYMYPKQLSSWLEVSKSIKGNVMIDSGAFSAWSKGYKIDIDKYIAYAHEAIKNGQEGGKTVRIVNLDVIPGKKGGSGSLQNFSNKENLKEIDRAASQGYENMKIMIENGITPIHVFHQGESWKWLDKMVENTDYIGISPANDLGVKDRGQWMESVFEYLYKKGAKVKTHGFAVWMPQILKKLPWTSCDAATWRLLAAWGKMLYPIGGFSNPDYSQRPWIIPISNKHNADGIGELTEGKVKTILKDGYTVEGLQEWSERAKVNIRYFLELQKWLNNHKRNIEYKPRKKLL